MSTFATVIINYLPERNSLIFEIISDLNKYFLSWTFMGSIQNFGQIQGLHSPQRKNMLKHRVQVPKHSVSFVLDQQTVE